MTSEWFSMMEKLGLIKKEDRTAFLAQDMREFLRNEIKRAKGSPDWAVSYNRATIYARLGENNRALEELNRSLHIRDHRMSQLRVTVAFDSLRSNPRFDAPLKRMNLTPLNH